MVKFVLFTDPQSKDMRDDLRQIYGAYVDFVVKNPLCAPNEPIRSEMFVSETDRIVHSINSLHASTASSSSATLPAR